MLNSYWVSTWWVWYTFKALQKDLSVFISSDLTWTSQISYIAAKVYKILGLLRCTFGNLHKPMAKKLEAPCTYQKTFCYWSYLNDYHSSYFDRLVKLQMLPLMYTLELFDIVFFLKTLKSPSTHFNIHDYITFATSPTRSSAFNKLQHKLASNNATRHSYFYRLAWLWNSLPSIDCTLSVSANKQIIYKYIWKNFTNNFNPDNPCTFSYLCPCNKCAYITLACNFK